MWLERAGRLLRVEWHHFWLHNYLTFHPLTNEVHGWSAEASILDPGCFEADWVAPFFGTESGRRYHRDIDWFLTG